MKKSSLQQFDLKKLLLIIIPVIAYIIPGTILMGFGNAVSITRFLVTLLIFAAAAYPLSVRLFPLSRSGGFTLAKPLGIVASTLLVWTLTYLKIGRINLVFILLSIALLGFLNWYPKSLREKALDTLTSPGTFENIIIEETLFAVVLTVLCFFKGFNPIINGQEKFMDYGFMMSMIRNPKLPANDMWLSGHSINYYYYGQYIYAFITILSGIKTGIAYNISMCCAIGLPFSMLYSIGQMMVDGAREHGMKCGKIPGIVFGLLTGCAVMIFGNSHSFYYDPDSIGNGLLDFFARFGINVGNTEKFFYPDSTRFIGYNPDSSTLMGINNGADYTIEEFPFYSYLIGDLHAHVCSTMNVLLIFAIAVSVVSRVFTAGFMNDESAVKGRSFKERILSELKYLICPETIAIAVLLGVNQMTNYWDFLIYFIFGSMLLLILNTYRSKDFSTIIGAGIFAVTVGGILGIYLVAAYMPILHTFLQFVLFALALAGCAKVPCALTRTSLGMSMFFSIASLVALPFNFNFEMISNKIAPCLNHSSMFQLFILWGTHVIICAVFVLFVIIYRKNTEIKGKKGGTRTIDVSNPVEQFFKERNPMDVLACGSIAVGLLLLAAPEIFYVRDIYTSGYLRSNTMFKFTYAGFIILSISMIYAIVRLMFMENKKGKMSLLTFSVSILFCCLLLIPAHYTKVALTQRSGELKIENFKTLDGTAYLDTFRSSQTANVSDGNLIDYSACIDWFNENVEGDPVILEAYGLSYTDCNIVSAYTGLPTVCGWQTHEWLWRYHGIVDKETDLLISDPDHDAWELYLTPRHRDIDTIYTSSNPDEVYELLKKYNVQYVIIGAIERNKYSGVDNTGLIASFGRVVFCSGDLMVIEIW